MYCKIALGNIKKSYKDYSIYFLTLILAVSIFYSFNSIYSQNAFKEMSFYGETFSAMLKRNISIISIFISMILGGLILYANNFLVKKRKKELGIYMSLGMGKEKISRILLIETFVVGVISLVIGIMLGIGLSQGLSVLTLTVFDLPISEYQFVISANTVAKTALYFGIMFFLVMIFNVFIISKYKIIDLLTAGRKNENMNSKNVIVYLIAFIISIVTIGCSYKFMLDTGSTMNNMKILIGLIVASTFLFFFSLSGFTLHVVKKNKNIYLKGLNLFVVKQLNSKVKTNFISISLICLMLFTTIVMLCTGISYKVQSDLALERKVPFDVSMALYNRDKNISIEELLESINFEIGKDEKYAVYNEYSSEVTLGDIIDIKNKNYENKNVRFVKISDYNKILKLKDKKEIKLNKDEVIISIYDNSLIDLMNEALKKNNKVDVKGEDFLVKNNKLTIEENLRVNNMDRDDCVIVLNDEFLADSKIKTSVLNINYLENNREELNKKYLQINEEFLTGKYADLKENFMAYVKDDIYASEKGFVTVLLFIGIYIGIVFLIASMAILALQQLSEASDSIVRYKALRRIGANKKMINKTIFAQTLIYFSLPMILALAHSVVGISLITKELNRFSQIDISSSVLMTTLIFIVIYTGYFYTTYIGYKNIVKNNI